MVIFHSYVSLPEGILSWSISLNVTYLVTCGMGNNIPNIVTCSVIFMLWQIHLTPSNCSKTLWMLLPCKKKSLRGFMYQVLGWVKSSTELYHPLIWETTRNPFLASRLQCVSPYDPVRDRQVKHKNNQGAVEQKGCSLVSTTKSITPRDQRSHSKPDRRSFKRLPLHGWELITCLLHSIYSSIHPS